MALLKNTIFIVLLLLFSLKFARCQENIWGGWGETGITETAIENNESTPEEWYPPQEEVI